MVSKIEALMELGRRGELPPKQAAALEELQNRGLISGAPFGPNASGGAAAEVGALVRGFGGAFNRGVVGMAGAVAEVGDALLGTVGLDAESRGKIPFLGSQSIKQGLDAAGRAVVTPLTPEGLDFFPEAPDTPAGRIVSRAGEVLGGSVLPAAGILKVAKGVPEVAKLGDTLAKRVFSAFRNPIRAAPGRATIGEAAAATFAGLTGGAVREAIPPGTDPLTAQRVQTGAEILGGFGPAIATVVTTPSRLAIKGGRALKEGLSTEAQIERARKRVRENIGDEMTPQAEANLAAVDEVRQRIDDPNFQPSTAEATDAPGLKAAQRDLQARSSGANLDDMVARRQASEQAVDDFATRQAPEGEGSPEFVIDTANKRVTALSEAIEGQQRATAASRENLADTRLPTADRAASGAFLRDRLNEARQAASEDMTALAKRLGINDADVSVNFAQLQNRVREELGRTSILEDTSRTNIPRVLSDIKGVKTKSTAKDTGLLDEFGRPISRQTKPKQVTFQDLTALRERISDDLTDALSSASPSRKKIRQLVRLKKIVDDSIGDLTRSADPDLAARYQQFRQQYFENYIQRFEKGAAFKIRQKDGRGFFRIQDEKVADAFFKAGDVAGARQYKAIFGSDPEALANLEAVALDNLRDSAVRNGVVDQRLLDGWLRRHRTVLDEFPKIKRSLSNIADANESMLARQAQLESRARIVSNNILTKELGRFTQGTKTAQEVIRSALGKPELMGELVAVLRRTPEGSAALRRNLWNMAMEGGAEQALSFVNQFRGSFQRVFKPQHFRDIETISAARAILERVPTATGTGLRAVPLEDVERILGQGIPQISSRIFAFKSGRMQKGYLVIDTLLRGLRGRAQASADDLMREALFDPEVARDMAATIGLKTPPQKLGKRLQARYFAIGLPFLGDEDEQ